ncbi:phage tail tape measure protein, partial [Microbacterium sp. ZW T5_45]
MLQRLTPQSKEAADKFKELGISAYDANGQFVGLANFSGQLKERMKDLTPEARNAAMAVMFGSDAVRGANVLYSEGEKGMLAWIKRLNEQGYATETARTRLDNLKGDWEAFTGALDTAFIVMGDGVDGPLREFVQGLTGLVDGYNELPQWAQQLIQVSGAAVGLIAGVGGASLLAIPKIVEFRQALTAMNTSFSRVTLVGGGITVALAAVAGVVLSLANAQAEGRQKAEDYMA